jgi:hypothetical protein
MIIELVQKLQKKSHILFLKVDHTKTTTLLWTTNHIPCSQRGFMLIQFVSPKTLPQNPIQLSSKTLLELERAKEMQRHRSKSRVD